MACLSPEKSEDGVEVPILETPSSTQIPELIPSPLPSKEALPEETQNPQDSIITETVEPVEDVFDPLSISKEVFDTTKAYVQVLISKLNLIIRGKDYSAWVYYLGPEYHAALSSAEFLKRVSESPILKNQNIILSSLRDYFNYVVVPSRANDRVDDIEFISQNRVKAFTIDSKGQRLRLYDLEKTEQGWKIVN